MSKSQLTAVERFLMAQDRLVLQSSDLSLKTLADMVESGAIDKQPLFQRRERWDTKKQSSLIESFLLNVPVPPIYLSEDEYGKYSVIDGKQRITAVTEFMSNRLSLSSLDRFVEIENCKLQDLPSELINALRVRPYFRIVTLLKQSDPRLKYDVFTRLNRGGTPLNRQEIRNVVFRGRLNEKLLALSQHPFLRLSLKIKNGKSSAFQKMDDIETVLRFLMMTEKWENFSGDYAEEMDNFMRNNSEKTQSYIDKLGEQFVQAIESCEQLWGNDAFKRPTGGGWRDQFLSGMYDAQMVATTFFAPQEIKKISESRKELLLGTKKLFESAEFETSVRAGTNTPTRVKLRIKETIKLLSSLK